jgi:predicted nuclease with TOPRIM domain
MKRSIGDMWSNGITTGYFYSAAEYEQLESRVRELEVEISALTNTITLVREDFNTLRARHAALVEKVKEIYNMVFFILQGKADMSTIQDIERGLKAALAEVK